MQKRSEHFKSGRATIPAGQPIPMPRFELEPNEYTGQHLPAFRWPHESAHIQSKADLEEALEHYSHPAPMHSSSPHMKTRDNMRHLVEWVYPALRWYCKVYDVPVPGWLQGNAWADNLTPDEHGRYFGDQPLNVAEWREDPAFAGHRT